MKATTFRFILLFGGICISCTFGLQLYWLHQAFNFQQEHFERQVTLALKETAEKIWQDNRTNFPITNPVQKQSSNYFTVNVNDLIQIEVLEQYLKQAFYKRNIHLDFEYIVYDCQYNQLVYGNFIHTNDAQKAQISKPIPLTENYFFGVYFPSVTPQIIEDMTIWFWSTFILILVVAFFGYSLFAIYKQRRLSVLQKEFVNNMMHEFKTPLSTIKLATEALQSTPQGNTDQYTQLLDESVGKLQDQLHIIFQHITSQNSYIPLNFNTIHLKNAILQTRALFLETHQNGKMKPQIELHGFDEESTISVDAFHFSQIVFNLFENAVKYCDKQPKIIVTYCVKVHWHVIQIKDNGIGMNRNTQKNIFKPYFRAAGLHTNPSKSWGLGMSYVLKIMKAHKGKIYVISAPNKGTTIELFFPKKSA